MNLADIIEEAARREGFSVVIDRDHNLVECKFPERVSKMIDNTGQERVFSRKPGIRQSRHITSVNDMHSWFSNNGKPLPIHEVAKESAEAPTKAALQVGEPEVVKSEVVKNEPKKTTKSVVPKPPTKK